MVVDSYLLRERIEAADIEGWRGLLPDRCGIIAANLFGDVFIRDGSGAIHMLDVGAGTIEPICESEAEFRTRCVADEDGWLLRHLADRCRDAGLVPAPGQCYAFTTLPIFGGEYVPSNVWLCSWKEWLAVTADIYMQTKDLPDGTRILLDTGDG
jgi:Domain of unknown function (DUF1851).